MDYGNSLWARASMIATIYWNSWSEHYSKIFKDISYDIACLDINSWIGIL